MVGWRMVTPNYFQALGIRILRGRGFADTDRAPTENPVIVSEALADKMFPQEDPVGKQLRFSSFDRQGPWRTIIGVAADVKNNGLVAPADPEFYVLLERLLRAQLSGAIGLRVRRIDREEAELMLTFQKELDPSIEANVLAVRQILGLDPSSREFRVVYGSVSANDKQIAILSRSILEILVDLSSFIAVPEAHVAERRVTPTAEAEVGPSGPFRPLIGIASSPERPADAFLAVPYRGHWFWIDDRDMPSKRLFSFLFFIFTLVETEGKEGAPILTIPVQ